MSAYDGKSIAEIIHDYAVIRGDLTEQYARDQLVGVIEQRIRAAKRDALRTTLAETLALLQELDAAWAPRTSEVCS